MFTISVCDFLWMLHSGFYFPFQLFENFSFGTLKLNSIHISQRFTVDSFGNYASCGQIDFSWGGSWEALKLNIILWVLREKSQHFKQWRDVGNWAVTSLGSSPRCRGAWWLSQSAVSQDSFGHGRTYACNICLFIFHRIYLISKALLWRCSSEAHWSSISQYFLYTYWFCSSL